MSKLFFRQPRRNPALTIILAALAGILVFVGCNPDKTPPVVTIIQPLDNATLGGVVGIRARATDDRSTPVVDFYVDGNVLGTDSTGADSIYSATWDASALDTGSTHKIKATAVDAAGNIGTSPEITVTIGIPAGPTNHSGAITARETWDPRGNPHVVTGNLSISSIVTIRPGVQVRIDSGIRINIGNNGGLLARGTSAEPILFTANGTPAFWDGMTVTLGATGDSVILEHCTIEYGGNDTLGANLTLNSNPVTIRNCVIRNGPGVGVKVNGNSLKEFAANTVTGNTRTPLRIDCRYVGVLAPDNQLGGNGRNVEVIGGTLVNSATWNDVGSDYTIMSDLAVGYPHGAVLHLNPGVHLRFRPGIGMFVGGPDSSTLGGLMVGGTSGDPVVFTSDSSLPNPGDWKGISLGHILMGDSVWINGARVEYAGGNGQGGIYLDSAPARITGTTVINSSVHGVYAAIGGFTEFANNMISSCQGYPVRITPEYVRTIGSNTLYNSPRSGVLISAGLVRTTSTWHNYFFPYVVGGLVDIVDASRPVLTLSAGDSILFQSGGGFRIGQTGYAPRDSGALVADGVVFTSTVPASVYWKGIQFQNNSLSAECILRNSVVKYAGADTYAPGNIVCQDAAPTLVNNEIANSSSFGIYLINSPLERDTLILYNNIHDNARGSIGP